MTSRRGFLQASAALAGAALFMAWDYGLWSFGAPGAGLMPGDREGHGGRRDHVERARERGDGAARVRTARRCAGGLTDPTGPGRGGNMAGWS